MISQYFNQINLLSYRGKKFSPSLVFELIKKHNRHLEKNKSKLGEIINSELIYECFTKVILIDILIFGSLWIFLNEKTITDIDLFICVFRGEI